MKVIVFACLLVLAAGLPKQKRDTRIIGGQPAADGDFPYQCSIIITKATGSFICGATVLLADYIMTAGHCTTGGLSIRATCGSILLDDPGINGQVLTAPGANIVTHEDYGAFGINRDIGFAQLSGTFTFDQFLSPATMPCKNTEVLKVGDSVVTSGFGLTADGGSVSQNLMFTDNLVMALSGCNDVFNTATPENVCVDTTNGHSSCNGDSGGPLTYDNGTHIVQRGIVSFGAAAGCEAGFPAAYVRVICFLGWLENNIPTYSSCGDYPQSVYTNCPTVFPTSTVLPRTDSTIQL